MKKMKNLLLVIMLAGMFYIPVNSQILQPIGNGLPANIITTCEYNNELYACYDSIYVDTKGNWKQYAKIFIEKWNGNFWAKLPYFTVTGYDSFLFNPIIKSIFFYKNELYVLGHYDSVLNIGGHNILKFDGTNWSNLDGGLQSKPALNFDINYIFFQNKIIFAGDIIMTGNKRPSGIASWDGTNWDTLKGGINVVTSILLAEFDNKLIVANMYLASAGSKTVHGIASWDGNNWDSLKGGITMTSNNINIEKILVFKNALYVSGAFDKSGGIATTNISYWDGNNWNMLGTPGNEGINKIPARTINVNNNQLVVSGYFTKAGGITVPNIASWSGSSWSSIINGVRIRTYSVDSNYFIVNGYDNNIIEINGLTAQNIKGNLKDVYPAIYISYGNKVYAQGQFSFISNPSKYYNLIVWDGNNWQPYLGDFPNTSDAFLTNTTYNDKMVFINPNNNPLISSFKNVALFIPGLGKITGQVYNDLNKNCIKDVMDNAATEQIVNINPDNHLVYTDKNGIFSGYIEPGFKTITLNKKGNYKYYTVNSCDSPSYNVIITDTTNKNNLDFSLKPISNVIDAEISCSGLKGFKTRHGFTETYYLNFTNNGTTNINSGLIKFITDTRAQFISSIPNYDSLNTNEYTWIYQNLQPGEKRSVKMYIKIPTTTLNIGDTAKFYTYITTSANDTDITNNYDTLKQVVVAAVDPNDKQCSPDGNIRPSTKKIDYIVNFQNVGTDIAYRVYVVDTIDTKTLSLAKIEIKGSSHPYQLTIRDNVFIWTFDNIYLPPKNINEPASQGFLRYTVYLKPGLNIGTKIENQAHIYFDYQKALPTNKTLNIISIVNSIEPERTITKAGITIYPNPSNNIIYICMDGNNQLIKQLNLIDLQGRTLKTLKVKPNEIHILEIAEYNEGIYLLKADDGSFTEKIMIIK
jgi:hypothetical protein